MVASDSSTIPELVEGRCFSSMTTRARTRDLNAVWSLVAPVVYSAPPGAGLAAAPLGVVLSLIGGCADRASAALGVSVAHIVRYRVPEVVHAMPSAAARRAHARRRVVAAARTRQLYDPFRANANCSSPFNPGWHGWLAHPCLPRAPCRIGIPQPDSVLGGAGGLAHPCLLGKPRAPPEIWRILQTSALSRPAAVSRPWPDPYRGHDRPSPVRLALT